MQKNTPRKFISLLRNKPIKKIIFFKLNSFLTSKKLNFFNSKYYTFLKSFLNSFKFEYDLIKKIWNYFFLIKKKILWKMRFWNSILNFFRSMDFFAKSFNFHWSSRRKKYGTFLGGFFSLCVIVAILLLLWSQSQDMIRKTKPKVIFEMQKNIKKPRF